MKIIGFNLEKTTYGLPLDNGGACLVIDGEIVMMINEERLNRKQYSSGFKQSINYLLENNQLNIEDIDLFVASSCLEPQSSVENAQTQLKNNGFEIDKDRIKICGKEMTLKLAIMALEEHIDISLIFAVFTDINTRES